MIDDEDIFTAVRAWLLSILPDGVEVLQTIVNKVAEPAGPDFVMMTIKAQTRKATNVETWDTEAVDPVTVDAVQSTGMTLQLDCHGDNGRNFAQIITTLWRSDFACRALLPAGIQPLYHEGPHQAPFMNGEKQYENRWVLDIAFQASPVVSAPQDFAATLSVDLQGIP